MRKRERERDRNILYLTATIKISKKSDGNILIQNDTTVALTERRISLGENKSKCEKKWENKLKE